MLVGKRHKRYVSERTYQYSRMKKRKASPLKVVLIVILVLALIGIAVAYSGYKYVDQKLEVIQEVPTVNHVEDYSDHSLSCVDVSGFINILILGLDARDLDDPSDWRSDAIVVASIKEDTGQVYLTSVYRDTMLLMGEGGFYDKMAHAFYYGGVKESIKTINQAMDLDVRNYIVFNIQGCVDIIDEMGGIELNIEEYEIEELNYTNKETWRISGKSGTPEEITTPGLQLVDGATAVSYGRMRNGVGDDYKRTERMRIVMQTLLAKAKTMSLKDINKVLDVGLPAIRTNLSNADILGLAFKLFNFEIAGTKSFPFTIGDGYLDEVSYVFPIDLYNDVALLHEEFFGQSSYQPSATVIEMSDYLYQAAGNAVDESGLPMGWVETEDTYVNEDYRPYDYDYSEEYYYEEPTYYEEDTGYYEEEYSGEEYYEEYNEEG